MQTTLAEMALMVAREVANVIQGTATDGDQTSLTDTVGLQHPNATWDKGTAWILTLAHAGKVLPVKSYATNKLTFYDRLSSVLCRKQVDTATVVGTIVNPGNATVTVTAAGMANSPKTLNVAVLGGDNASAVAGKIRIALAADADVAGYFDVGGSGADVVLTVKKAVANDLTTNIATANGTCTGLTAEPISVHTTAGIAGPAYALISQDFPYSQLIGGISAALHKVRISDENYTLVGNGTTLKFTLPIGVSDVYEVKFEPSTDADRRTRSTHWDEVNGELHFDNGHAPRDGDIIHLWFHKPHGVVSKYDDTIDDEINLEWLKYAAAFYVLEWAKGEYGDDEEFNILERQQIVNEALKGKTWFKDVKVSVHSA